MTRNSNGKKLVTVKKYRETHGVHPSDRRRIKVHSTQVKGPSKRSSRTIPLLSDDPGGSSLIRRWLPFDRGEQATEEWPTG